jgi:hypothetical protein
MEIVLEGHYYKIKDSGHLVVIEEKSTKLENSDEYYYEGKEGGYFNKKPFPHIEYRYISGPMAGRRESFEENRFISKIARYYNP